VSKRCFLPGLLLACLVLGCNQRPPPSGPVARAPVVDEKPIAEIVKDETDDVTKQIDAAAAALEQQAVSFLIDGARDGQHANELFAKVHGLTDAGTKQPTAHARGGYGNGMYFRISPISDIEAAAAKVDFGLVVAVDPVERIILMDASAKPAPRPPQGWPGTKAIDQYVVRKTALQFERYPKDLIKQFGRDKVVVVCLPFPGNQHTLKRLSTLAPDTYAAEYFPGSGPQQTIFMFYAVAPVAKVSDVVKLLDDVGSLTVDEERRIIIVDLPSLRPRPPEAKEPRPVPRK
jgi:hypothetical protein